MKIFVHEFCDCTISTEVDNIFIREVEVSEMNNGVDTYYVTENDVIYDSKNTILEQMLYTLFREDGIYYYVSLQPKRDTFIKAILNHYMERIEHTSQNLEELRNKLMRFNLKYVLNSRNAES